jgi:hypothetical protein
MPTVTKTIVVLADSWKKGGKCLAGKELNMEGNSIVGVGQWIRPISSAHVVTPGKSEGGQVTDQEIRKVLGRECGPRMLEVIDMSFSGPCATTEQPENWTLDMSVRWKSRGYLKWKHIEMLVDHPDELWDSSGRGWNRVDGGYEQRPGFQSLYCIKTISPIIAEIGSRPIKRGSLEQKLYRTLKLPHGYQTHDFTISDPVFEAAHKAQYPAVGAPTKEFVIPTGTLVTVSLTPAVSFTGALPYHYKMAAAIIQPPVA